jgi:hypothetical protein
VLKIFLEKATTGASVYISNASPDCFLGGYVYSSLKSVCPHDGHLGGCDVKPSA